MRWKSEYADYYESPVYVIGREHYDSTDEPELSEEYIQQRIDEFWTWEDGKSIASKVILECAVDSIARNEKKWQNLWLSLKSRIEKFPELKREMELFIREEVEAGNDKWA